MLKTSSNSNPASVAGAIAGKIKTGHKAEITAIGAGAVNNAVKGIAIARGYVAPLGYNLVCTPCFSTVQIEGENRTVNAIKFIVEAI